MAPFAIGARARFAESQRKTMCEVLWAAGRGRPVGVCGVWVGCVCVACGPYVVVCVVWPVAILAQM